MSTFLFYVEPFPIRNSFVCFPPNFRHFGESLLNNKTEHNFLIYGNKEALKYLQDKNSEYEKHFVLPTTQEDKLFESYLCNWDEEGMAQWQSLMTKSEISDKFIELIKNLHKRASFDYIVCWGTNFAVKQAAKELGIGFINMELGCSRSPFLDSLVADPWGVNGNSALSQAKISDFQDISPSETEADLMFGNRKDSIPYEEKFSYVSSSTLLNLPKDKKIAYIPLQLYDDANLLQYSPYDTVEQVMTDILPSLLENNHLCIIKEHPLSVTRLGAKYANLRARLYAMQHDGVIWLTNKDKSLPNSFLFQNSDVVITVNSSTGFEALYYDKPVIVLGEAVYKIDGVFPDLQNYLSGNFDYEAYKVNIGKIRNFFIHHYLFSHEQANDSKFFFPYLKFIGDMSKKDLTTKQIVEAYYNRS